MFLFSILLWLLYKRMFNLIPKHKTHCIPVLSNFSCYNQSRVMFALSGKQTFPLSRVQIHYLQLSLKQLHSKTHDSCHSNNWGGGGGAEHP